jgi:hypothetical protein
MSSDADWPWLAPDFFMFSSYTSGASAPARSDEIMPVGSMRRLTRIIHKPL